MPEPIISVAEMREREGRTWAAGVSEESVIRRAGAAVAHAVLRRTRSNDAILVLAGMGNNGEDAIVADQHLADRDSELIRLRDPASFEAARQWLEAHAVRPGAWVVDGLFGIGLNRPLEGDWRRLVETLNRSKLPVFAVDVPSGLDADTGLEQGVAVEAAVTVTLGAVKAGLLREQAARWVGRIELASNIGLVACGSMSDRLWTLASDFSGFPPRRPDEGHKGRFGHVGIVAGSVGYHGAAVLAAQGALRARPGLVTVWTDAACYGPVAAQLRAAMVVPWRGERLPCEELTAMVVGPGLASPALSPALRAEVRRIWCEAPGIVVADATALDWLPPGPLHPGAGARVLTPHPGEAARLLGVGVGEIQEDRFRSVRQMGARWAPAPVLVVLKGRHTVVGGTAGALRVNSTGNPGLAQGGSGDLLAGYLGGLLGQPLLQADLMTSVCYGVWRHGLAADLLEAQRRDWGVEDLPEVLARGVETERP